MFWCIYFNLIKGANRINLTKFIRNIIPTIFKFIIRAHKMQRDTHILKIVNIGRTFRKDTGVKCFPEQTYGISQQSPDQFKKPHSLTPRNGYLYKQDQKHPSNTINEEQLNIGLERIYANTAISQRRYCSVVGDSIDQVANFRDVYNDDDVTSFRRKKGRLSQFMDKNGWMNKTYKLIGSERNDAARCASNKIRQNKIKSLVKKKKFDNPVALKAEPKQFRTSSLIYTEKAKIRGYRVSFRQKNNATLDIQRSISPTKDKFLQAEEISNKLGRTMLDKQWRSTMSTIRNKSSQKGNQLGLTCSDWNDNYRKVAGVKEQIQTDHLKSWYNTTCNSNGNPWKYRKPKKIHTNSSQQQIEND